VSTIARPVYDLDAGREHRFRLETGYGSDWWKQFDLRDTFIAGIAREYGLTVATRNTKHFPYCETVNPFQG
jgi:predicted nucleic acid-binding protein